MEPAWNRYVLTVRVRVGVVLQKQAQNFADVVPAVFQTWYPRFSDMMNVERR
jgi:hypothetical protein